MNVHHFYFTSKLKVSAIEAKVEREEGFDGIDEIDEKQQNNKEDTDNNRENGDANSRFV